MQSLASEMSTNTLIGKGKYMVNVVNNDFLHYIGIMIKGSLQEEDETIRNIYGSNIEASKYIKQILTDIK